MNWCRVNYHQRDLRFYSKEVLRTCLRDRLGVKSLSNNRDELIKLIQQEAKRAKEDSGISKMFEQAEDDEKSEPIQGSGLGLKTPKYAIRCTSSLFPPSPASAHQFVALLKHYLVKNHVHTATYKRLNPNQKDLWDKLITRSQGGQIRKRIE